MLGSTQRILVERKMKGNDGTVIGRTENNRSVSFIGDSLLIGKFVDVDIIEAFSNSLRGKLSPECVIS